MKIDNPKNKKTRRKEFLKIRALVNNCVCKSKQKTFHKNFLILNPKIKVLKEFINYWIYYDFVMDLLRLNFIYIEYLLTEKSK